MIDIDTIIGLIAITAFHYHLIYKALFEKAKH